ncbi:MAG: 3-deoxy-D-manno-octulosonic acid transferase [Elusimicrobia bacterium]|nr:3-deoxy-D-manno-octulosonic acid transferase [Elusimicrobiota bacterium]MDE2424876.1 3-deoxy-D-manno-octulosonic acid transferase [Elusimicrobiota bacterium]
MALLLLLEDLLAPFAAAAVALRFLLSSRRSALKGLRAELPERLGRPALPPGLGNERVWLHCASAGEVNAAAALVRELSRRGKAVLLTATTAAGRERARALEGVAAAFLAPLDCGPAVSSFLSRAKPGLLLVVETELWPRMLEASLRRGLPCAVVNARMSPRSFKGYRLLSPLLRPLLGRLSLVAAQSEEDARRFRALGAARVEVIGNMKYDAPLPAASLEAQARFSLLRWEGRAVFCAGSTHAGEEEALLDAFAALEGELKPSPRLILAPRHLERAQELARLLERRGLAFCRWSAPDPAARILLLDELGALAALYALSDIAFVGGTLVPVGGHNLLEPALAGLPVLFGPHTEHQAETARRLERGGGLRVESPERLAPLLLELLERPERRRKLGAAARRTAEDMRGATSRALALLGPILSPQVLGP